MTMWYLFLGLMVLGTYLLGTLVLGQIVGWIVWLGLGRPDIHEFGDAELASFEIRHRVSSVVSHGSVAAVLLVFGHEVSWLALAFPGWIAGALLGWVIWTLAGPRVPNADWSFMNTWGGSFAILTLVAVAFGVYVFGWRPV